MERIILKEKNFEKVRDFLKKNEGKEIIFSSFDDDLNRKVIEKLNVSGLLISLSGRRDYYKQRNSGFNQVMAKICKKRGIFLAFDFDEIVLAKNKSEILSRLKQNIFLCNKNKVQIKFVFDKYKRNTSELRSFGLVLGMPTWMTKGL